MCELYQQAPFLATTGVHLLSTDEMTGIQALERAAPTKPARPGQLEKCEFNYLRHGTLSLIANLEVASGRVVCATLGPSRTEADFATHIEQTIATDAKAGWIFILDQLNTHQSASLVALVKTHLELASLDLGVKGQSGILSNRKTRAEFLSSPDHRIRFVYTPKHASWLNQIEIWFSILMRRLLKRSSFSSRDELRERIISFIEHFNQVMAKPFKWTFTGRPLQA